MKPLVLAMWFTHRSSTGSRSFRFTKYFFLGTWPKTMTSLRCPRNGQANETRHTVSALSYIATGSLEQASGKADKVVFASPDTGQQGAFTLVVNA
jgi:hypothetical protein